MLLLTVPRPSSTEKHWESSSEQWQWVNGHFLSRLRRNFKVLFGCHSSGITDERQNNKALLIQNCYANGTLESRLWACRAPGVRCLTQRYSYTGLSPTPLSPGLNGESPMRRHCKPAAWWKPNSQDGAGAWLKKPNKEETTLRWAAVSQPAGIRPSAWGLPPGSFREQEGMLFSPREPERDRLGGDGLGLMSSARRPRITPRRPALPSRPGSRLSRPRRPPATSSGCSCGSPPPTRDAPTRARTPALAPGRGWSGSSAAGRTRRGAELRGGGGRGPAPTQSAALTIPAVQFGGLRSRRTAPAEPPKSPEA